MNKYKWLNYNKFGRDIDEIAKKTLYLSVK